MIIDRSFNLPIYLEYLNRIPRLPLAYTPTPLMELKRLRFLLKGPQIFMKREDLTGFAMGGNKVRKFEFFIADALRKGADCCIAIGTIQSNHTRLTVASALQYGLKVYLLLMGEKPSEVRGNLLLDYLLGAEIIFIKELFDFEERLNALLEMAEGLKKDGKKPYILPVASPLGCLGPLMAMEETVNQAKALGIEFRYQFIPVGSGETLLGLIVGVTINRLETETIGICIGRDKIFIDPLIQTLTHGLNDLLGGIIEQTTLKYTLLDGQFGKAGHPTRESIDAICLLAKTEGIFLDPIYTGKTMAFMLDLIRKGNFNQNENWLFWNTSSSPIFFAYENCYDFNLL